MTVLMPLIGLHEPMTIGDADGVLSSRWAVLPMAGQATVARGERAERRLDAPAQRQRTEPLGLRLTRGDLNLHAMAGCCLVHPRTRVDPIRLHPHRRPARLGGAVQ